MIIDREEHRDALLQLIDGSSFPGRSVDLVYELKQAILGAIIAPNIRDCGPRASTGSDAT